MTDVVLQVYEYKRNSLRSFWIKVVLYSNFYLLVWTEAKVKSPTAWINQGGFKSWTDGKIKGKKMPHHPVLSSHEHLLLCWWCTLNQHCWECSHLWLLKPALEIPSIREQLPLTNKDPWLRLNHCHLWPDKIMMTRLTEAEVESERHTNALFLFPFHHTLWPCHTWHLKLLRDRRLIWSASRICLSSRYEHILCVYPLSLNKSIAIG